jgi:hypothetical protein
VKAVWLYRIAAVLFVLFAILHTVGFLSFKAPTAEGLAVWESMNRVHFQIGSANFSYGDFYKGFGLFVSVYSFFSGFVAWHLAALSAKSPGAIGYLGWALCAVQVASFILSAVYYSTPQMTLTGILAVCSGWAAISVKRDHLV